MESEAGPNRHMVLVESNKRKCNTGLRIHVVLTLHFCCSFQIKIVISIAGPFSFSNLFQIDISDYKTPRITSTLRGKLSKSARHNLNRFFSS